MPNDTSNDSANNADDDLRQEIELSLSLAHGMRWEAMSKDQQTNQVTKWLDGYKRGIIPTLLDYENAETIEESPTEEQMTRLANQLSPEGQSELHRLSDLRKSLLQEHDVLTLGAVNHRLRELMEQAAESAVEKASQNGVGDNGSVDTSQRNEQ